jgi:hypothetical protein
MRPVRRAARSTAREMLDASGATGQVSRCLSDHQIRAHFPTLDHATRFLHYTAEVNLWWPPAQDWSPPPEPKVWSATVALPDPRHRSVSVVVAFNTRWLAHVLDSITV